MGSGRKGASGGSAAARDYFASFAGVICYGPVDELVSVVIDGKVAWQPGSPVLRSASANPYVFDVDGWGRVHFYWGTETQTLTDPVLTVPGRDHPPYRRRALAVFERFLCGRERTSVPDISFVLRRTPKQSIVSGTAADIDADGQVNPVAAIAEMLTDGVVGLGMDAAELDIASFQNTANELEDRAWADYLTIEATASTRLRSMLSQINGYADLWFRSDTNGRISVGRFTDDGSISGLPVLTRHDLASGADPAYDVRSLADADGRVTLRFTNRRQAFQDDYAVFSNGLRRDSIGRDDPAEVDRKWIRRAGQAAFAAAQIGARESMSFHKFELTLREERADALHPGQRLVWQDDMLGVSFVARVISRSGDADLGGHVRLGCETERSISGIAGTGSGDLLEGLEDEVLTDCEMWRPLQATPQLLTANNEDFGAAEKLFFLVGKHQAISQGYGLYFRKRNATQFQFLGNSHSWAVPMVHVGGPDGPTASGSTIDTTGNIRIAINNYPSPNTYIGFDEIQSAPSEDEIEDDMWLAIWVSTIAGGNTRIFEIMTIIALLPHSTPGTYLLHAKRGRLGTAKRTWQGFHSVFLINRYDIDFFSHLSLPAIAGGSSIADRTITCDVAPFSASQTVGVGSNPLTLELT